MTTSTTKPASAPVRLDALTPAQRALVTFLLNQPKRTAVDVVKAGRA